MQMDTQLANVNIQAQQAAKNQVYLHLVNMRLMKMKTGLSV